MGRNYCYCYCPSRDGNSNDIRISATVVSGALFLCQFSTAASNKVTAGELYSTNIVMLKPYIADIQGNYPI